MLTILTIVTITVVVALLGIGIFILWIVYNLPSFQ